MTKKLATEIISSLFILLFVYTALSKLMDFTPFRAILHKSPLIGENATFVAIALPFTEIIVSLLLFVPRTRLWGFYSSSVLMTTFTLYLGYMILFTPKLPCSCGGVLKQMNWNLHLFFNIFFLLLAFTGVILERKRNKLKPGMDLPPVVFT